MFFVARRGRTAVRSPQISGLSNHLRALGRRCGQPGQQQGRRLPAWRSPIARWIRRLRVVPCFAEMTQQTHSFRANGVRSSQAACVVASEPRALRKSAGVLWKGPRVLSFFIVLAESVSQVFGHALPTIVSTSADRVIHKLSRRRPLRHFHWLLHNDIERDHEAENDRKEVDRQRRDVGCCAVLEAF